jgi:hypothetical protein
MFGWGWYTTPDGLVQKAAAGKGGELQPATPAHEMELCSDDIATPPL